MKYPRRLIKYLFLCFGGIYYIFSRLQKTNSFGSSQIWPKAQPRIRWGRILLFLMCLSVGLLLWSIHIARSGYNEIATQKISGCAVIFGAAVWRDDVPSHALNDRIQAGIKLHQEEMVDCLIMTGGPSSQGSHEAEVMKREALKAGIPAQKIIRDLDGSNTLASIIKLPKNQPYIFVSNDFHLGRIGLIARQQGIANYQLHHAEYLQGEYRSDSYYFWREVVGVFLFGLLGWWQ